MDKRALRAVGVSVGVVGALIVLGIIGRASDDRSEDRGAMPPVSDMPDGEPSMIGDCPDLGADAPTLWTGAPASDGITIRVGPGTDYPIHESGELIAGETVFVLQECTGWIEARAMSLDNVKRWGYRSVTDAASKQRADEMLTFWAPADLIQRNP